MENPKIRVELEMPSNDLVLDSIKKFPHRPLEFNFSFIAHGIHPNSVRDKYLYAIYEKGVIPYSTVYCNYTGNDVNPRRTNRFRPADTPLDFFTVSKIEGNLGVISELFGGKYHRIYVKSDCGGFEDFKEEFLPFIFGKDYTLFDGKITSIKDTKDEQKVEWCLNGRGFVTDVRNLELLIAQDCAKSREDEFKNWFDEIARNHLASYVLEESDKEKVRINFKREVDKITSSS